MSCLIDTKTLTRWKKLTPWWQDYSYDMSCHSSKNWPQRTETNWPWNWRLTVLKTGDSGHSTNDQFQDHCQSWLCCFAYSPVPPSIKALAPFCQWGSQPLDRSPPSTCPQELVSWIKKTFLSTNLASLLASEWQVARPPCSVIIVSTTSSLFGD